MESGTDIITRRAARVLLVDAAGRVLLLHGRDPARPSEQYWFTPGGGIEPGETPVQAAARELHEETGLAATAEELGTSVFVGVVEFTFGGRRYRQEQDFFLYRVDTWQPTFAGFDVIEHATIDGHRWWSADDLEETAERYYPADLPRRLRRLPSLRPTSDHAGGRCA